ncbi:hypothetical protein [Paenibacillus rubinfantis]|uniref:hypothetical protein n=1 Tax=Paenibacillus rubinfantis TaxID=1720296 RepID=UPI00073F2B51|nr:hypothetical protein [Paenibacillus rubinfantis]
MDQEKRRIILKEIDHWRRSRLLPEQYCDFLENLYKEDPAEGSSSRSGFSLNTLIQQGSLKFWSLSFGIISFFFFIVFYFNVFPWGLQIAVTLFLSAGCYALAAYHRRNKPLFSMSITGLGSLLLLGFGSWIIAIQGWPPGIATTLLIAFCGFVWLVLGYALRFGIISYCGFACGMLLYAFLLGQTNPSASWGMLQIFWLPLAAIFFWLSWLGYHRIKALAPVFFAVSVSLWFMPEADAFLLRDVEMPAMPALLLLKIGMAFLLLFGLRKKWVVWITS